MSLALVLALWICPPTRAASGTAVIAQNPAQPKKKNDTVCVERENRSIQCGKVIDASSTELVVNFDMAGKGVQVLPDEPQAPAPASVPAPARAAARAENTPKQLGPRFPKRKAATAKKKAAPVVAVSPPPPAPTPVRAPTVAPVVTATPPPPTSPVAATAAVTNPVSPVPVDEPSPEPAPGRHRRAASVEPKINSVIPAPRKVYSTGVGAGLKAGADFFYPHLYLEAGLQRRLSVGAQLVYASGEGSVSDLVTFGGALTANYFLTSDRFEGLHLQGQLGALKITHTKDNVSSDFTPVFISGTANWAWVTGFGLRLSLGAGLEYVLGSRTDLIKYGGLQPHGILQLGYCF